MGNIIEYIPKSKNSPESTDLKIRIIFIGLFVLFILIVIAKVTYDLQIGEYDEYIKLAGSQKRTRIVEAIRGEIFDRNGKFLVKNEPAYQLTITPVFFPSKRRQPELRQQLLQFISETVDMPVDEIEKKIKIDRRTGNPSDPVPIKSNLPLDVVKPFLERREEFIGIECRPFPKRNFVLKKNLSHIVGHTGIIDKPTLLKIKTIDSEYKNQYHRNSIIGKNGLEFQYDTLLRGKTGKVEEYVNSLGEPVGGIIKREPTEEGKSIVLTIQKDIQEIAYRALGDKTGVVIVTKPKTGEILAMASKPAFDPNTYTHKFEKLLDDPAKPLTNRAAKGLYPPGSIMKIVLACAALEEKRLGNPRLQNWTPDKTFTCTGSVFLGKDRMEFKCTGVHGPTNLHDGLRQSCNSYFYNLGQILGVDIIHKWAKKFKLGDTYESDFGDMYNGLVPSREWKKEKAPDNMPVWLPGDTANMSIGQGFLYLTPIQVHNIISTIASGGYLYKPYLVDSIVDSSTGKTIHKTESLRLVKEKILSDSTVKYVRDALRDVVRAGTAWRARISKTPMTGKTGSGQIYQVEGEEDELTEEEKEKKKYVHAWFTGYAPYGEEDNDDLVAVTVVCEHIKGYGGTVSAPIATAVIKYMFEGKSLEETDKELGGNYFVETAEMIEEKIQEESENLEIENSQRIFKEEKEQEVKRHLMLLNKEQEEKVKTQEKEKIKEELQDKKWMLFTQKAEELKKFEKEIKKQQRRNMLRVSQSKIPESDKPQLKVMQNLLINEDMQFRNEIRENELQSYQEAERRRLALLEAQRRKEEAEKRRLDREKRQQEQKEREKKEKLNKLRELQKELKRKEEQKQKEVEKIKTKKQQSDWLREMIEEEEEKINTYGADL